ncbi:type II toxin-antitoxin system RelE/ParE family toxin [Phenylobacterium sp. 20VBR1]|uniref:Type II toxin-antitoxin system RelE/ParE family toxin n=1 Tax=Phenylobacterium glaciei TaxID=2803784 RepID=A0A941D4D7_9CAUL|nr:type II toxin-antitoxin system RelE/ParE family toxin [Phenylobacterium glaciei]MBR7620666.1 type II toxin-antitoxin system RelE/ParE family toxin [Phenylobacterium glaciei]
MTWEVRLSVRARIDLERLVDFLVRKNPNAARRARQTLAEGFASLAEFADRGRQGPRADLRELPVRFGRAAYVIQYRIEPDRVIVAHIFHSMEGG